MRDPHRSMREHQLQICVGRVLSITLIDAQQRAAAQESPLWSLAQLVATRLLGVGPIGLAVLGAEHLVVYDRIAADRNRQQAEALRLEELAGRRSFAGVDVLVI